MLWSSPIALAAIFSMWRRNAPTSFQSLKMLGTHTNTACWLVGSPEVSTWTVSPVCRLGVHTLTLCLTAGMVDVIFADVAQPDQTRIVALNAHNFLKNGGHFVISIKVEQFTVYNRHRCSSDHILCCHRDRNSCVKNQIESLGEIYSMTHCFWQSLDIVDMDYMASHICAAFSMWSVAVCSHSVLSAVWNLTCLALLRLTV